MEDVKTEVSNTQEVAGGTESPSQNTPTETKSDEQAESNVAIDTAQATQQPSVPERMVPYNRFQEVNQKMREAQKRLAEYEQSQKLNQYAPEDFDAVVQHPYVQELLIDKAKRELTDFARSELDKYPNMHPAVKKAIVSNARGFVKETTTDVETAKEDLLEYIEQLVAEEQAQAQVAAQAPKSFKVAETNTPSSEKAVRPADIDRIVKKPIDEWTADEEKIVADYKKNLR